MTVTRPYPVDKAYPNASDLRKAQSTIFPRGGVFPDPTTVAAAGIAYAGSGWAVGARAFTANLKRGGAPFSQTYGAVQIANDGVVAAAWTLPGGPSSGSIVSLLWVRATDPTQGEALTQVAGEVGADGQPRPRAVPVFGITTGTTTVAPVLPAGAELVARVTIASTSTSAATSTIVQAYDFAHVLGGVAYYRTETLLLAAASAFMDGERAFAIDTRNEFIKKGAGWSNVTPAHVLIGAPIVGTMPAVPNWRTAGGAMLVSTNSDGLFRVLIPAGTFPNALTEARADRYDFSVYGITNQMVVGSGQAPLSTTEVWFAVIDPQTKNRLPSLSNVPMIVSFRGC